MELNYQRFNGKVAVVTGGASGIGLAIAEGLLKEGAYVVAGDLNEKNLEELQVKLGKNFIGIKMDVTNESDQIRLVKAATEKFGHLDLGFNVAGTLKLGIIDEISEEDWMFTINICLKGVFLGMKHQISSIKKNGGAIVNISSLNGEVPMWGGSAYTSAKAGVDMLTRNAVLEYTKYNIRFNAVLPGLIETPLSKGFVENSASREVFMERIPIKRPGKPKELANAALFLASEDASYITGATLIVDGGWSTTGYPDLSAFF